MDLPAIAAAVGILNIVFLGLNSVMILNIKLAIANMRAEMSENRRRDAEAMHAAIDTRIANHMRSCKGYEAAEGRSA